MDTKNPIRGCVFGGFNRKDVAGYIEELVRKSNEYKAECDTLRERCSSLEAEQSGYEQLRPDYEALAAELEALRSAQAELSAENQRLSEENAMLRAELSDAQENAEVYHAAKERLAALEVEASKRSIILEREAKRDAEETARRSSETVEEVQASLDAVRREALRMKDRFRCQLSSIEQSLDELSALTQSKQEFLNKYILSESSDK